MLVDTGVFSGIKTMLRKHERRDLSEPPYSVLYYLVFSGYLAIWLQSKSVSLVPRAFPTRIRRNRVQH